MAYLSKAKKLSKPAVADDFNCGWSITRMLARLSATPEQPKADEHDLPVAKTATLHQFKPGMARVDAMGT